MPKANGTVRLCLDPAWLNQLLTRTVHRGPTLNDILPKLNNTKFISVIDASSGYHNLRLDKRSSYLMIFTCQFGRCRYKQYPFGVAPAGDMFQRKIDKFFKELPNVFGIAGDILVVGYEADGKNHDETLWRVLQICRQVNLNLNKNKCHFRWYTSVLFFGEIKSWHGVKPDPQMLKALMEMLPPDRKELQAFLEIINYLGKFSPSTANMCEPLRKLTSSKTLWT